MRFHRARKALAIPESRNASMNLHGRVAFHRNPLFKEKMGQRWNAALPGSGNADRQNWTRIGAMNRGGDASSPGGGRGASAAEGDEGVAATYGSWRARAAIALLSGLLAGSLKAGPVADVVPPVASAFCLTNVTLLAGPFRDAMLRDKAYLLSLDPDRLLYTFRTNVGLSTSNAVPYGGWEAPGVELRGHIMGHYLSACSRMYASTGDPQLKSRIDYLVAELAKCQAASPANGFHPGYLAAFPESFIDRVVARQPVWAPWYTIHKIMAGLLDAYQIAGNTQALTVLTNEANWVQFRMDQLTTSQIQSMLNTEFGGMNEVLANLYAVTGNTNDLRIAEDFDHQAVFDPLAARVDALDPLHVNTQIPKIIGAAREYEMTGLTRYRTIASFFWDRVALHRSYVIGLPGDNEYFFPITDFARHLSAATCETCNGYNLLKLTRHLFSWTPSATYMDYYERVLYNDILASQEPDQGMMTYFMSLKPGHFKTYSTPENSFWCCVGTGMENHSKYGGTIYFHGTNSLYVNLFIASQLKWPDKGLTVRQDTVFPRSDTTTLTFHCTNAVPLTLEIRYPAWAREGMELSINDTPWSVTNSPDSYVSVARTWQNNDQVQIHLPMTLRTEPLPGNPDIVALLYGPIVLAGELGTNDMPASDFAAGQGDLLGVADPPVPVLVGDTNSLISDTTPVPGQPLTFQTHGVGQPRDVTLIPFYELQHQRYSVYWNVMSPSDWQQFAASNAVYEASVVDQVAIADAASEAAHGLQQSNSATGSYNGRTWRDANESRSSTGWFSYSMGVQPNVAMDLACTYWGSDSGGRVFDILVDGTVIASQTLTNNAPGQFFTVNYPLPLNLTAGRTNVTVRFEAHPGQLAGGVFGLEMVTAQQPGELLGIDMTMRSTQPLGTGHQMPVVVDNFQNLTNHPISNSPWLILSSSNTNVVTIGSNNEIQAVGLGTATVTASYLGYTVSRTISVVRAHAALEHRYSFSSAEVLNGTNVVDALHPAQAEWCATLRGNAVVSGGQLVLDGMTGTYVDLPPRIVSRDNAISIEVWASFDTQPDWTYLFGFGETMTNGAGARGFSFTPHSSDGVCRLWVSDTAPGSDDEFRIDGGGILDNTGLRQIVAVLDLNFGYEALYLDGVLVGERGDVPFAARALADPYSYIGRSLYSWDPYLAGRVSEFRIYQGRMSPAEVAATYALGPDTLLSDVKLQIKPIGTQHLVVSWPTNAIGFSLQSATQLGAGESWTTVGAAPSAVKKSWQVMIPWTNTLRFFRLAR